MGFKRKKQNENQKKTHVLIGKQSKRTVAEVPLLVDRPRNHVMLNKWQGSRFIREGTKEKSGTLVPGSECEVQSGICAEGYLCVTEK